MILKVLAAASRSQAIAKPLILLVALLAGETELRGGTQQNQASKGDRERPSALASVLREVCFSRKGITHFEKMYKFFMTYLYQSLIVMIRNIGINPARQTPVTKNIPAASSIRH